MYNDQDLKTFTATHFPQYLPLLTSLSGVYMADMARVLLVYHYGGIYADLDFYCARPYRCLVKQAYQIVAAQIAKSGEAVATNSSAVSAAHAGGEARPVRREMRSQQSQQQRQRRTQADTPAAPASVSAVPAAAVPASESAVPAAAAADTHKTIDVLVVSQETKVHSVLFHNKTRVVIQDFFMATPKHPFLLYLLEDRLKAFTASTAGTSTASRNTTGTASTAGASVSAPPAKPAKGPFSYSIEKDLDAYHAVLQERWGWGGRSVVVELSPDVLHPLADASNLRYKAACVGVPGMTPQLKARIQQLEVEAEGGETGAEASVDTGEEAGAGAGVVETSAGTGTGVDAVAKTGTETGNGTATRRRQTETQTQGAQTQGAQGAQGAQGLSLWEERIHACDNVKRGRFLSPSSRTAMVHMWTHVYLALPSLRSMYNAPTYRRTERAIHPTPNCFDE
jgi:hypothetical protein